MAEHNWFGGSEITWLECQKNHVVFEDTDPAPMNYCPSCGLELSTSK